MKDKTYINLKKRLDEVYAVSPNDLHNSYLNSIYKFTTARLKTYPFWIIIPTAIATAILLHFLLGLLLVRITSILQHGF